jgi:hypothetical protein
MLNALARKAVCVTMEPHYARRFPRLGLLGQGPLLRRTLTAPGVSTQEANGVA